MFLRRLLAFVGINTEHSRRSRGSAWPETRLFEEEKSQFLKVHSEYQTIIRFLMESYNPEFNKLSMKYHSEAFQFIYIGFTRTYEVAEMKVSFRKLRQEEE
ncbi:hypothetical protein GCK72_023653 [Caenorhabditis remanei]|uniref:Uncharacterized protein n=1 Tax=Caenorhabditis remanei TaxID=31234 RepID=A0A6A5FXD8_CAERE|nr:hypothetical protein GCK72_023653 [Caenorhabditis remanei]KAF1747192.1 hypothetical protein GCK72_023653 [Caenorhabditis remanei]